ncbi:MAG: C39 family peptidase [Candidatus Eisenbacteria bacterium]
MRSLALFLLILLSVSPPVQSLSAVTHVEAQAVAALRVAEVAEYSRANPDAAGAFAPWAEGEVYPGQPVLVHRYPGLEPSYYIVPLVDAGSTATSFITIDVALGAWQAYGELPDGRGYPRVDRESARATASDRLGRSFARSDLLAVSMPNRGIYWRAESGGGEVFINLWEEGDVRIRSDEELTTPRDLGRDRHVDESGADEPEAPGNPQPGRYPTTYNITSVPHYYQGTSYHCGPAALEMVFDYWGQHVNQTDIGYAAKTQSGHGTWSDDLRRAAHFSQNSTAVLDPSLQGYDERWTGYAASENQWSFPGTGDPDYVDRHNDLKNLISSDYPVLILSWYDSSHNSGHFRVVKGYDDNTDEYIVHDPWYSPPYQGPNVHFAQTFLVDDLWTQWYRWGLFAAPWLYDYSFPSPLPRGLEFTLSIDVTYPGPHPFDGDYAASSPYAYLVPSGGYQLAPGENAMQLIPTISATGTSGSASWQVIAPCGSSPVALAGHLLGVVTGSSTSYAIYTDQIGEITSVTLAASANPNYIYVDDSGGWDFLTIQDGIDAAPCDGDEVQVWEGIYVGNSNKNLDFGGKNLKLKGIFGPGPTIIDCQDVGRGVYLHSGEDTTALVSGFTIAAGNPSGTYTYGGGILCDEASAKFTNLVVTACQANYGGGMAWIDAAPILQDVYVINNTAYDYGGGIFCTRDSLGRFERVEIMDNVAGYSGGGMYDTYSSHSFFDVIFHGNIADFGGAMYIGRSAPVMTRSLFQHNSALRGGAMFIPYESTCEISRSTIVNNSNTQAGWGVIQGNDSEPLIYQSIIAYNDGGLGIGCTGPKYPTIYNSLSYANAGGDSLCGTYHDNLFRDPYFCDEPADDYMLHDDSPCLPAFNPWAVQIGKYGVGGCGLAGIDDGDLPATSLLFHGSSPNPFRGSATITYELPERSTDFTVAVYGVSGRLVRTLYDGPASAGPGTLAWNGTDDAGRRVAAGVYFVRASFGEEKVSTKLVVLR